MKKITILSKPNLLLLGFFLSTTIFSQVLINSIDQKSKCNGCYDYGFRTVRNLTNIKLSGKVSNTPTRKLTNEAMVAPKTKIKRK